MNFRGKCRRLLRQVSPVYRRLCRIEETLEMLRLERQQHDRKAEMMFWWQIAREGETLEDTKRRFFRAMPPATGVLRTIQEGNTCLLRCIKRILQEEGIPYWLSFGTLLGAARHGGFVPWDDDVDISVLKEDLPRLYRALEGHAFLELKTYYHSEDRWHVLKLVPRGDAPFWLDILTYERVPAGQGEFLQVETKVEELRAECDRRIAKAKLQKTYQSEPLSPEDEAALAAIYRSLPALSFDAGRGDFLYRSMDTVYMGDEGLLCTEDVFPLTFLPFEGETYPVPGGHEQYLTRLYHYMDLPSDPVPGHIDCSKSNAAYLLESLSKLRQLCGDAFT